jgi:hypothetical protein
LGIGDELAPTGAVESRPKTAGVVIVPLSDSRPVVAEAVFVVNFDSEFIEDAEHGGALPDALLHDVVSPWSFITTDHYPQQLAGDGWTGRFELEKMCAMSTSPRQTRYYHR